MSDYPEEYRDGYVLFCGQKVMVDQRALIPRIETEELVKYVLRILKNEPSIDTLVDIGTGSGVIPLSLASKYPGKLTIIATDMSKDALDLAQENLSAFSDKSLKDIFLFQGDLLEPIISHFSAASLNNILITANLPYVLTREVVGDLIHEPKLAFIGGEKTGFELYERFFEQLHAWKTRPKNCHIVIEFGLWQRDVAETVLARYSWEYIFFSDLRDIERFCHIIITS